MAGPQDISAPEYLIAAGAALLGGAVRFIKEWRENFTTWETKRVFLEGVVNALYAGFAGLLTFWLLYSWKVDPFYSAFACAIMGHMGPEGVSLLKDVISNGLRSRAAPPPSKE